MHKDITKFSELQIGDMFTDNVEFKPVYVKLNSEFVLVLDEQNIVDHTTNYRWPNQKVLYLGKGKVKSEYPQQ